MEMNSPGLAGREPGNVPAGATTEAVPAISTEACPVPCELAVNSAGMIGAICTVTVVDTTPCVITSGTEACPMTPRNGTWKLICPGDTKNNGVILPPMVMVVPPSVNGNGGARSATAVRADRFKPKIDPILRCASTSPPAGLAALTKALPLVWGAGPMLNVVTFEAPPPDAAVNANTEALPTAAMSLAGI